MILSVRDIEELIFCPKLFYYHVVLGIGKFRGFWEDTGKNFEEKRKKDILRIFEKDYIVLEDKIYESKN